MYVIYKYIHVIYTYVRYIYIPPTHQSFDFGPVQTVTCGTQSSKQSSKESSKTETQDHTPKFRLCPN